MGYRAVVAIGAALAVGTAFVACDVPPPQAPVRIFIETPVERFSLANGLEVVVQPDHRTPHVAVNVRYHVGSKDDLPRRAGMAHLVEHLEFAEIQGIPSDGFFRTMLELGGEDINGATDDDGTSYYETVPTSSLEAALWVEAQRMASARLGWTPTAIDREKRIVAQELELRYRNQPNGFRYQLLTRAVYPDGHPYRHSLDEEAQEGSATSDELREFAERFYGPNDATLLLVGDVTPSHAKELAERYFGAEQPCAGAKPRVIAPVDRAAFKRVRVVADRPNTIVYVAWPLPAPGEDGFYEAQYALSQLEGSAAWYGDDQGTIAPRSFGWGFDARRLGSLGYIYASPGPKATADDVVDALEIMHRRIVAHDWAHTGAYRSSYIARVVRDSEALGDRAREMQEYRDFFGDPNHIMADLHDLQLVTRSRVVAAVDRFLDLDRAAVVVVSPDAKAPRSGNVVEEVPR